MEIQQQYLVEPNINRMPECFNSKISVWAELEFALRHADIII